MAGDVLRWNSRGSSSESLVVALRFVGSEFPLRMGVEIGAVAIEREHDEEFRVQARGGNLGGGQPLDGGIQGLSKSHESISPQVPMHSWLLPPTL